MDIELICEDEVVSLSVRDNGGRGFDARQLAQVGGHLGLLSMRERVRLVKGTLEVESARSGRHTDPSGDSAERRSIPCLSHVSCWPTITPLSWRASPTWKGTMNWSVRWGMGVHFLRPRRPCSQTSSSWMLHAIAEWHRRGGAAEKICPNAKIIVVTMHADTDYVRAAFEVGLSGDVLKGSRLWMNWTRRFRAVLAGHS